MYVLGPMTLVQSVPGARLVAQMELEAFNAAARDLNAAWLPMELGLAVRIMAELVGTAGVHYYRKSGPRRILSRKDHMEVLTLPRTPSG